MTDLADPSYVKVQYGDSQRLDARIALHTRFSTNPYDWHRWVFDQFDLPPRARVLEVGCGPGELWWRNRDRLPPGWSVVLADLSPGMVCAARRRLEGAGTALAWCAADAGALPFAEASFDGLVANHMLYHVPDRSRALSEMRRVLRHGGRLYAATNGRAHMGELWAWVRRVAPDVGLSRDESRAFTLDNGGAQISRWFPEFHLRRFESDLRVTEAGPLVAYVRSLGLLSEEELDALAAQVEDELAARGAIHIAKEQGLFEAQRF
jgi:SAM-dependent methyltransferase